MNTLKTLLLILTLTTTLTAQDKDYKGPAKTYVSTFWRQAEVFKNGKGTETNVTNMEKAIAGVKEKDPSYKTSAMEEELKKWQEILKNETDQVAGEEQKLKQDKEKKQDLLRRQVKISNILDGLYKFGSIGISGSGAKEDAWKAKIIDFTEKANVAVAFKKDGGKINDSYIDYIKKENLTTDKYIQQAKDDLKQAKENLTGVYYETQLHLIYWKYAIDLFPGIQEFVDAQTKIEKFASEIGSLDEANAKANANKLDAIKNTKLPNPVVNDAALEKVMIDGFNKTFNSQGATALKAVLTQDGWTTLRNPITSVITGRERSAKVAYKKSDGKCYMITDYVFIHEEYIGGAFTNRKAVYNGLFGSEMLCENIK